MESRGSSISHEHAVFGQIGEQFNNPDLSDVTLKVGEQSYFAHRFVLAAQSSVFRSMLMDDRWKESIEKVVQLRESQEGEDAFCEFLKYFYTGKLTFLDDNVCGIHMLADKYDMPMVKRDAENFMEDVLSGVCGEALPSSLKWIAHIEKYIPDLLPKCYEAVQTNFFGLLISEEEFVQALDMLASRHLKEILTCPSSEKDIVVYSEMQLYKFLLSWAKVNFKQLSSKKAKSEFRTILPLIRFHNMSGEELQKVEESELCKAMGKSFVSDYISPAYKVHSQRLSMVEDARKNRKLSRADAVEYKCPCDSDDVCPHLNPRFYFPPLHPFAISQWCKTSSKKNVQPLDLGTLETCVKIYTDEKADEGSWTIDWKDNLSEDDHHINEIFTVKPVRSDIGRKFTMVVVVAGREKTQVYRYMYAIKHTDVVKTTSGQSYAEPILLHSPLRPKTSWKIHMGDEPFWIGVSIHLHKP